MGKYKYTNKQLLKILKEYYNKNLIVSEKDFKSSNNLPACSTYIKRFGSWNNAKELAGISTDNKIKKEDIIKSFKEIVNKTGRIPLLDELNKRKDFPSIKFIYDYFKNYHEFIQECGFTSSKDHGTKYKKDFLINEIKRFVNEFGKIPTPKDFENLKGYPTRKTFTNHFKSFHDALKEAGFESTYLTREQYNDRYKNKEYLSGIVYEFIGKYKKIPRLKDMTKEYSHSLKSLYKQVYGGWNNALKELGLPLNSVSQYDDDFLESEFHRFVKENGRIPKMHEFNTSEYPSFWCYQNRFDSWNNAVIYYGYEPNDSNRKYILDDGEICASSYEFDISTWLKDNNVNYARNIKYIDFIDNYKGKMDCDYVMPYGGTIWYVEMAGFLSGNNFSKFSDAEKNYFFKLKYKRKLLRRQNLNYIIIEPCDLKKKTLEEIFFFLDLSDRKDVINNGKSG